MKNMLQVMMISIALGVLGVGCGNVVNDEAKLVSKSNVPFNTIGVYIVIDYSGSMAENVMNEGGVQEQKCAIVKRSLSSMGKKFDDYLASNSGLNIFSGLIVLDGGRVVVADNVFLKNGVQDKYNSWKTYLNHNPYGGTPLGNAIEEAYNQMKSLSIKSKNIIVLTDGESNQGDTPESVIAKFNTENTNGIMVGVHFVAFDINASCFNGVKSLGATVLGASNENELNEKINVILKDKILLEKED
jgi:hypothetical protein